MRQLKITQKLTNIDTGSFKQYLREVSDIEVFTPEEELICARKACKGDKKAIDELVMRNLRFVISVAKQYTTDEMQIEDLVNEGNLGLIMAANRFDPAMGYKFISFAVWWIRKLILEHINTNGKMVRLPSNQINNISKIEKKVIEMEQVLGRTVDVKEAIYELREELGKTKSKKKKKAVEDGDEEEKNEFLLADMFSRYSMDSFDRPISSESDGQSCLGDLFDDKSTPDTDHLVNGSNVNNSIEAMLSILKPRDREIITLLFGLNGGDPMTLKEVGEEVGLTREMIRQVRNTCLERLKNSPRVKNLMENTF